MINSDGYVFCQKLKTEGLKKILAASECIHKMSENVVTRAEELKTKGLLHLNKIQHADANGKFISLDFAIRKAALGFNIASFLVAPDQLSATSLALEGTSEGLEYLAKKDQDLTPGAEVQKKVSRFLQTAEILTLLYSNLPLATIVIASKLVKPALDSLDKFAFEHGQDWKTKTGGLYERA